MSTIHVVDGADQERVKYAEVWQHPDYHKFSPGLENVERFMSVVQPDMTRYNSLIDIGCGAGIAGLEFASRGFHVNYLDITDAALSPEVDRSRFIQAVLWENAWTRHRALGWDYGLCCDVMEHIPPEYTMLCIDRILSACRTAWFSICNLPDNFGRLIGQPLHLTVQPYSWWLMRLAMLGEVVDARDLCGNSLFVVRRK